MNDDQLNLAFRQIEQGLVQDDPAFVQRLRALYRAEIAAVVTVFLLLAGGAVLLTVGLATLSWPIWVAGVSALLASVVVDEHHRRVVERSSGSN
ncbi:MAG TPA: DUF3040 domain-containing protein [Acidimicrobiales bacterium]|jgi:hypothetical protein|nr:DUF3040 domain-containing protein [Acidimicrobiales bacterium]